MFELGVTVKSGLINKSEPTCSPVKSNEPPEPSRVPRPGGSCSCVKLPKPSPLIIKLSSIVGFSIALQQTPLSVTVAWENSQNSDAEVTVIVSFHAELSLQPVACHKCGTMYPQNSGCPICRRGA